MVVSPLESSTSTSTTALAARSSSLSRPLSTILVKSRPTPPTTRSARPSPLRSTSLIEVVRSSPPMSVPASKTGLLGVAELKTLRYRRSGEPRLPATRSRSPSPSTSPRATELVRLASVDRDPVAGAEGARAVVEEQPVGLAEVAGDHVGEAVAVDVAGGQRQGQRRRSRVAQRGLGSLEGLLELELLGQQRQEVLGAADLAGGLQHAVLVAVAPRVQGEAAGDQVQVAVVVDVHQRQRGGQHRLGDLVGLRVGLDPAAAVARVDLGALAAVLVGGRGGEGEHALRWRRRAR